MVLDDDGGLCDVGDYVYFFCVIMIVVVLCCFCYLGDIFDVCCVLLIVGVFVLIVECLMCFWYMVFVF